MLQRGYEARDIDPHRTARHAPRLLAAQTALRLVQRPVQVEAKSHLVEILDTLVWRLVRHGSALAWDRLQVLRNTRARRHRNRSWQLTRRGGATAEFRRGL